MDLETDSVNDEVRDSGHVATQLFHTKQIHEYTRVTDKALSYFEPRNSNSETFTKAPVTAHNTICYHKSICEKKNRSTLRLFL
jgi:hypothetical protein